MSQGDLSARIHFLKCEEEGYPDATIADILDVGINVIQEWLSGSIAKS